MREGEREGGREGRKEGKKKEREECLSPFITSELKVFLPPTLLP
jgi:hypothetical protein